MRYWSLIILLFVSCEEGNRLNGFSFTAEELNYFNEIAFYSEVSRSEKDFIIKWDKDLHIRLEGNPSKENREIVNYVLNEINGIGISVKLKISNKDHNVSLFIGRKNDYYEKTGKKFHKGILGNVDINFNNSFLSKGRINEASIFISDTLNYNQKKSVMLEEVIQSLGLNGDTGTLRNSIFYEMEKTITEIPEIDKKMLRILYHPVIKAGLSKEKFREFFKDSLNNYNTEQKIINYCLKYDINPDILDTIAKHADSQGKIHLFQNDEICIHSPQPEFFSESFKKEVGKLNEISSNINLKFCEDSIKYQGIQFTVIDTMGLKGYQSNYKVNHRINLLNPRRYYATVKIKTDLHKTSQAKLDSIFKSSLVKAISIYKYGGKVNDSAYKDYKKMLQLYYSNVIPSNFSAERLKNISRNYKKSL